jgi:hypothetical protein
MRRRSDPKGDKGTRRSFIFTEHVGRMERRDLWEELGLVGRIILK